MSTTVDVGRVARNYKQWQGLRRVPNGLAGVAAALVVSGWITDSATFVVLAVAAVVLVAAESMVGAYYDRTFGRIGESRSLMVGRVLSQLGVIALAVPAAFADIALRLPVLLLGLVMAAEVLMFWYVTGAGRRHWPALSAVLLAVAAAPAAGLVAPGRPGVAVTLVVTGLVHVVGGILDHRALLAGLRGVRQRVEGVDG